MLEMKEMLKITNQIEGNDESTGIHYLCGYLWGVITDEQQEYYFNKFKAELEENK